MKIFGKNFLEKKMNNNLKQPFELNLNTVFKDKEYIIPIYQRSYAWEKNEIEQLLTDIQDSVGNYYLGSLIVDEISHNYYSVIDGQQRLTTIFLLLSFLKNNSLTSNSLRFEAREKSNETLKIIKNNTNNEMDEDSYLSPEIIRGYKIIQNYFKPHDTEFINQFKSKLSNILIICTQVPKKIDLNHYFEIMNTRGEQLEIHEIAKGRLLSVIEDAQDRSIAAEIWDACSQMDSYIQMNFDSDTRNKIFGETWDIFSPKTFNDLRNSFAINNLNEDEIHFSLFDQLTNKVKTETNEENKENDEKERFESIISFPNFLLIVNEATCMDKDNDFSLDDKNFIKNLKHNWDNNNCALEFIYNLLYCRFLFDTLVVKREYAKDYKEEGKWSLQKLEMYNNDDKKKPLYKNTFPQEDENYDNLRNIQATLRITYTSPKTMHWISILLSSLKPGTVIDSKNILNTLETYACNKIKEAKYETATGFGIERIIFTYLDYILIRDKKVEIPDYQIQFRTSIEHFYPQHPTENEKWNEKDLNSLGNLALITVTANSRFSNLSPSSKISTYPDTINQSPKLKLMSKIMSDNKNEWTTSLVEKHKQEMFELLQNEFLRLNI